MSSLGEVVEVNGWNLIIHTWPAVAGSDKFRYSVSSIRRLDGELSGSTESPAEDRDSDPESLFNTRDEASAAALAWAETNLK